MQLIIEKTGLNEYVYGFSVGFNITKTGHIINIHKHFMKKGETKQSLDLLKECLSDY